MDEAAGIYARASTYLDRHVQVGIAQGRVIAVSFPETPAEDADPSHELLDRIEAYLGGEREEFADVTVALTLPTDRRTVLERLRELPYGEDVTVERLTRLVAGLDAAEEADRDLVREALADNPAPVLVPDHRVRDAPGAAPADVARKLRALEGL